MAVRLPRSQDFWSGVLFTSFGAAALWFGRKYTMGSTVRMGPGYFPSVLGWILCGLGLLLAIRGILAESEQVEGASLRPFLILPAIVAFALLLETAGLVIATTVLIGIGSLAGREFKVWEVAATTIVLVLLSVGVFIWGLGLQVTAWPAR